MAEAGVTYADLRFAKRPLDKSHPSPAGDAHEEASDGELTYENFSAAGPRKPAGPDPDPPPQAPGAAGRGIWSAIPLAVLGACLFLLATCLGLGLRYWQISRQLEEESSALAQRMGRQEENLTRSLQQLSLAQAELNATRLALWHSWQAGNGTQRQLEKEREEAQSHLADLQQQQAEAIREREQRELAESRLDSLQREKARVDRELEEARSCQQRGCCPPGWTLFRWKCLWVSWDKKTWEQSRRDCGRQEAHLLMLKPEDAATISDAAVMLSCLQLEEFWIGLKGWHWVDGARYRGTEKPSGGAGSCVKMSGRALTYDTCSSTQRYICEKATAPFPLSVDPSA